MERLITDAEKLNDTFHAARDANGELALSYSDIIDAIHIVQTEMGITGTTAKEASSTISGSINTAKAAWENLITAFGDGTADLDSKITDFVDSVQTVGENVLPVAEQVLDGISIMIEKVAPVLSEAIPSIIDTILPPLIEASGKIIGALVVGIIKGIPDILAAIGMLFVNLMEEIGKWMTPAALKGKEIVQNIGNGISNAFNVVVEKASQLIQKFIEGIKNFFGQVKQVGTDIVNNVKDGIASKIEDAKQWGSDLIHNFIDGVKSAWESVKGFFSNIGQGIKDVLGFSEPKIGPLSNFHTFAPDMMKLYAKGIRENSYLVTDEVDRLAKQMNLGFNLDTKNKGLFGSTYDTRDGMTGSVNVVQNIYSNAKTEADLMQEAILYQERAVLMGV